MTGAAAPKLEPVARRDSADATPSARRIAARPFQGELFDTRPEGNVIPIARYAPVSPKPRTAPSRPSVRKPRPVPEGQGTLDFLQPMPAKPRELGSTVESVIYCEFPVATTLHRAVSAALDWGMVLLGFGLFLCAAWLLGCQFTLTKTHVMTYGAMFLTIAFSYGLCFALVGSETPGMTWTRLRLTTFDGFPPDARQRLGRFLAASLNRCTVLGLLWSLADEECLTWQDHMSRTFPTPRDAESTVFRMR
jgi:uncharacterized RDD family membrane protein YckC